MNVRLLKSKMILFGDDDCIKSLANLLEISRQTAAAKLKGFSEFTRTEIALITKHYGLTDEEIRKIFVEDSENDS